MTGLRLVTKRRTRNVQAREHCSWCDDSGFVVVSLRQQRSVLIVDGEPVEKSAEYEELGPCPHCERGFAIEFPDPKRFEGSGRPPGIEPPWDREEGFWRGRSSADIRPMLELVQAPAPDAGESAA